MRRLLIVALLSLAGCGGPDAASSLRVCPCCFGVVLASKFDDHAKACKMIHFPHYISPPRR